MSRHRDVRNMDFSEDYDGYDDVYGHSVDDDYYISPSHRQFMYSRENSAASKSGDVYPMEQDIQEEDETGEELKLTEAEKQKLESCMDYVKSILAPIKMPRQEIVKIVIENKFESEKILNTILNIQSTSTVERKDRDETIFSNITINDLEKSKSRISDIHNTPPSIFQNTGKVCEPNKNFLSKISRENTQKASHYKINATGNIKFPLEQLNNIDNNSENIKFSPPKSTTDYGDVKSFLNKISTKENNSLGLSFLSKIKQDDRDIAKNDGNSLRNNFLSNIKPSQDNDLHIDSNSQTLPAVSFLSKIKTPTAESETKLSQNKSLKQVTTDSDELENITRDFLSSLKLPKRKSESEKETRSNSSFNSKDHLNILRNIRSEILEPPKTEISDNLSKLKLTEVSSLPTFNNSKESFDIDLTQALTTSKTSNLKLKIDSSEDAFEIPFVAYNDEVENSSKILKLTLDISHLATEKTLYEKKRPSKLGRIICLRYKLPKFKMKTRNLTRLSSLKMFDFSTPSPDEQICKYLRRNL